jgi:hypothetical protein
MSRVAGSANLFLNIRSTAHTRTKGVGVLVCASVATLLVLALVWGLS